MDTPSSEKIHEYILEEEMQLNTKDNDIGSGALIFDNKPFANTNRALFIGWILFFTVTFIITVFIIRRALKAHCNIKKSCG